MCWFESNLPHMEIKKLTNKFLDDMNDRNLLAYYKAERERFFKWESQYKKDEAFTWDNAPAHWIIPERNLHENWIRYLNKVKTILSKRDNVEK